MKLTLMQRLKTEAYFYYTTNKNNLYVSKACGRLENQCSLHFFFFFFFAYFFPLTFFYCQKKCQVWVSHKFCPVWNMKHDCWLNQKQDWNKSEHRVQVVCCLMCFCAWHMISFDTYFGRKKEIRGEKTKCLNVILI